VLGGTVFATVPITTLENTGDPSSFQQVTSIDADEGRFVVTYDENISLSTGGAYLASFALLPGEVQCLEAHMRLSPSGAYGRGADVVSTSSTGGPHRRFGVAWHETTTASGTGDIHGALFDAATIFTYCYGDGTGTACPCGNNGTAGRGCANSVYSAGAHLTAVGTANVSADTAQLQAISMPNGAACLFFQGTTSGANGGLGAVFGDGLRCTGGSTIRLGFATTALTAAVLPSGGPSLSVLGNIPAGGGVRYYQVWYRNSAAFCTSSPFNLTNGTRIVWLP
jgi:hypothetical protein